MMGPAEAVGHCLARYTGFSGRAGRAEFWWFAGFVVLFAVLFSRLEAAMGLEALLTMPESAQPRPGYQPLFVYEAPGPIAGTWLAAMALPFLAAATRRLHDRGMGPGWLLLFLVPVAGWIVIVTFLGLGGEIVENEHGLPPAGTVAGE